MVVLLTYGLCNRKKPVSHLTSAARLACSRNKRCLGLPGVCYCCPYVNFVGLDLPVIVIYGVWVCPYVNLVGLGLPVIVIYGVKFGRMLRLLVSTIVSTSLIS